MGEEQTVLGGQRRGEPPGWRRAPEQRQVEAMFDGLVDRYELLNRLISLGLDGAWRRAAIRAVGARPRDRVLDLGCGTGDLLALLVDGARVPSPSLSARRPRRTGGRGTLGAKRDASTAGYFGPVGMDVSARMLARTQARLGARVGLVRASAFQLPFADASFQGAVSAFVLRNLRDLEGAMAELARVLAPGARIALLDATEPRGLLRPAFDVYFRLAGTVLGALIGQRNAYEYLASSLAQIPPPAEMCRLLANAGFSDCEARPLTFGVVTLFTARRAENTEFRIQNSELSRRQRSMFAGTDTAARLSWDVSPNNSWRGKPSLNQ